MLYLPHTVIVRKPVTVVDGDYVEGGTAYHSPLSLQVQLTPAKSAQAAFEASGVNIDSPYLMVWEATSPHACPVGSQIEHDGHRYTVRTPTQVFSAHPVAANCSCYLEENQFTPEGLDLLTAADTPSMGQGGQSGGSGKGDLGTIDPGG